jgi:predicted RNA binding protein with dsRBD fold (UPF0201 family)
MPEDVEKVLKSIAKFFPREVFPVKPKAIEKSRKSKFGVEETVKASITAEQIAL